MQRIPEKYNLLIEEYKKIEDTSDEKEIHDKRVILRRVFTILDLYGINSSEVKFGESAFRLFGKLRDIQIQIMKLKDINEGDEMHEYIVFLKEQEIRYKNKIDKFCKEKRVEFPEIASNKIEPSEVEKKITERFGKVVSRTRFLKKSNAKAIHKVRIAFKYFRYMLEILVYIEKVDVIKLKKLKAYQDLLGTVQDYEVLVKGITKFFGMKDYDKRKDLNIFERNEQLKILRFIEKKIIL